MFEYRLVSEGADDRVFKVETRQFIYLLWLHSSEAKADAYTTGSINNTPELRRYKQRSPSWQSLLPKTDDNNIAIILSRTS
jgi:hypothetical protein